MSIGNSVLNLMYGNPLAPLGGGPAALPQNRGAMAPGSPPASPGSQTGVPGSPTPAPVPGAPSMPSPATQSPQDLVQLYSQLTQRAQAAHGIDQGLAMIAAANSTPSMQRAIMGSVSQQPDPGTMMGNIMQLQQMQLQRQQYGAMMNAIQSGQLTEQTGIQPNVLATMFMSNPGQFGEELSKLVGGTDLDQRQYLSEMRANQQAGQPTVDFSTWKAQHATAATVGTEAGKDKLNSIETFPELDPQYKTAEDTVTWLKAHPDATVKAVQWGQAAGGRVGQAVGAFGILDQDTRDARAKINQLNDENFRAGLSNVKNVRSQSEANKVGGSVSSLDNPSNSPQMIGSELDRLNNTILGARGNLMAAAGKTIPYRYNGLVDPAYLNPGSAVYNGAEMEKPADLSKMSEADADAAFAKLSPGSAYIGPDGVPRTK